jgi:hypothetical protein
MQIGPVAKRRLGLSDGQWTGTRRTGDAGAGPKGMACGMGHGPPRAARRAGHDDVTHNNT